MLDRYINQGRADALRRFGFDKLAAAVPGVPGAAAGGFMDKAKAFGSGQLGAAKDLFGNLRAGLGGASPHASLEGPVPSPEWHRGAAVGNLKTLAPSLLAGGGLYMLHRHNQAKQEQQAQQARQQAMMGGGGYPMM